MVTNIVSSQIPWRSSDVDELAYQPQHLRKLAHYSSTDLIHELGDALGAGAAPRGARGHQKAPRLVAGVAVLTAGEGGPVQLVARCDVADEACVEALCGAKDKKLAHWHIHKTLSIDQAGFQLVQGLLHAANVMWLRCLCRCSRLRMT